MLRRGFWMAIGVWAGVWGILRVQRMAQTVSVQGLGELTARRARHLRADVRAALAEGRRAKRDVEAALRAEDRGRRPVGAATLIDATVTDRPRALPPR